MHIYNDYEGMHMPIANDELMRWSVNPQHEIHFLIHRHIHKKMKYMFEYVYEYKF